MSYRLVLWNIDLTLVDVVRVSGTPTRMRSAG
jgi:hypothetical protein